MFYVKDGPGNKVYQSVRFVVLDIDDNPPVFRNTPYKVDVSENAAVGSVLFEQIEAVDKDGPLFNKFTFTLKDESNLFQLGKMNYISSGCYSTQLSLVDELDYEKAKSHVVTISAIGDNSAFTASTEIVINVLDFPDRPPEFSQSPYYVKIEEELPEVRKVNLSLSQKNIY